MPPSRILVTGASRGGIGGAICRRLAADAVTRHGAAAITVTASRGGPDLKLLAAELEDSGASVLTVAGDLSDPDFPADLVTEAARHGGGLDAVVSNAGRSQHGPLAGLRPAEWDHALAVHARAAWLLARAAFGHLEESRGSFTATGSVSGTVPHAGRGAYAVAKAALIALCQQLALEWAPSGVRVNVVSPGLVSTLAKPKPYAAGIVPAGRAGLPEDIAAAVAFLASPEASYITGQNLVIDGGLAAAGLGAALESGRRG